MKNPVKACGTNINNLKVWYKGSFDDISNNGNTGITVQGNTIVKDSNDCSVSGFENDRILIPYQVPTNAYTIIYVAKYESLELTKRQRIICAKNSNYLVGFWHGNVGVCHQGNGAWITAFTGTPISKSTDWLISTAYPNKYRKNGIDISNGNTANVPGTLQLGINYCDHYNEASDFSMYELMIFDEILSINQMRCLEEYISQEHNIPIDGYTPIPTTVPAKVCYYDAVSQPTISPTTTPSYIPTTSPIVSKFFVGQSSGEDFTSAIATCNAKGAVIATMKTQDDYNKLLALCQPFGNCWIGLNRISDPSRQDTWEYIDGTPAAGTYGFDSNGLPTYGQGPWDSTQPANTGEGCAGIWTGTGRMHDFPCAWSNYAGFNFATLCMNIDYEIKLWMYI